MPLPRVVHLIRQIGFGGASQAALLAARHTPGVVPLLVSLLPAAEPGLSAARAAGIELLSAPDDAQLWQLIDDADLIHVHFWNNPDLYRLLRGPWPSSRVLLWSHVAGLHPPQVIPQELVAWADAIAVTSPVSLTLPPLAGAPVGVVHLVPPNVDVLELAVVAPPPHAGFNVGYLGTVDFAKLHPDFVALCAGVNVPAARFLVAGLGGAYDQLRHQAQALGVADRFELRGFVKSVGAYLAELDVFGYPLIPGNYATAELALQEAQYLGVPPVVFDQPSMRYVVQHNHTGLLVSTATEYCRAIEYLYHQPAERARLSANARAYGQRHYAPERVGSQFAELYAAMLDHPKRSRVWPANSYAGPWPAASAFLSSLAGTAPEFAGSLAATDPRAALAADAIIEQSGPRMAAPAAGGVIDYRRRFPNDAILRLWSGLVLLGQRRPALALGEFHHARRLGLEEWRLDWHIVRAARACGSPGAAAEALVRLRAAAPDIIAADELDAPPRSDG
jgi:glycosyltransferase involved in cell wall biosynthesis